MIHFFPLWLLALSRFPPSFFFLFFPRQKDQGGLGVKGCKASSLLTLGANGWTHMAPVTQPNYLTHSQNQGKCRSKATESSLAVELKSSVLILRGILFERHCAKLECVCMNVHVHFKDTLKPHLWPAVLCAPETVCYLIFKPALHLLSQWQIW